MAVLPPYALVCCQELRAFVFVMSLKKMEGGGMLMSQHAVTCWSSQWWCPWWGLTVRYCIFCSGHLMRLCSPHHQRGIVIIPKSHLCRATSSPLLWTSRVLSSSIFHDLGWSSSPQMASMWLKESPSLPDWLPLADCGGSAPLKPPFILFILHWINFTLAPPSIPSASPLPSPNPESSFPLEIMSIIYPHRGQELWYLSTYNTQIFPVNHHKLFSPPPRGARRHFAWLPVVLCPSMDLCWFCSWERASCQTVKMLMGWLCNRHCLWAAGTSSVLLFMTPCRTGPGETHSKCLNYACSFTCFGRLKLVREGRIFLLVTASGNWTWIW